MPTPNIIVMDTETTGVECAEDRLVEISGVRLSDGKTFETLVNPGRDIPAEARGIHHIGPEDVVSAPDETEAYRLFREALHDDSEITVYVAHNAKFDRGFIDRIAPGNALFWACTYKAALVHYPDAPSHKNQTLRYWLGLKPVLPEGLYPHRALYDSIVTAEILKDLMRSSSIGDLVRLSNNPVLLPKVNFGKHKGLTWDKVPHGYLKWCLSQSDMDENVLHTANHYYRR